jgi:hypothetical protein
MPPRGVTSAKRKRQYAHVKDSELARGVGEDRAEEIAARTVNKQRAQSGETRQARKGSGAGTSARKSARKSAGKSAGTSARKSGGAARGKASAGRAGATRSAGSSRGGARSGSPKPAAGRTRKAASKKR